MDVCLVALIVLFFAFVFVNKRCHFLTGLNWEFHRCDIHLAKRFLIDFFKLGVGSCVTFWKWKWKRTWILWLQCVFKENYQDTIEWRALCCYFWCWVSILSFQHKSWSFFCTFLIAQFISAIICLFIYSAQLQLHVHYWCAYNVYIFEWKDFQS